MTTILESIEFTASDGQSYNAVFEHFFTHSPNRAEVFLNGGKIGEATWYGDDDGLLDRFPDATPVQAWDEVCDRIEQEVEYRLQGHKRALFCPTFKTARDEMLRYQEGQWVGRKHNYQALIITGFPVDDEGTLVEGTFLHD